MSRVGCLKFWLFMYIFYDQKLDKLMHSLLILQAIFPPWFSLIAGALLEQTDLFWVTDITSSAFTHLLGDWKTANYRIYILKAEVNPAEFWQGQEECEWWETHWRKHQKTPAELISTLLPQNCQKHFNTNFSHVGENKDLSISYSEFREKLTVCLP